MRELARAAGISHTLLMQVRNGRTRLSPETVERVVRALRDWSATCAELAERLEEAAGEARRGGPA